MLVIDKYKLLSEKTVTVDAFTSNGVLKKLTWALAEIQGSAKVVCVNDRYSGNEKSIEQLEELKELDKGFEIEGNQLLNIPVEGVLILMQVYG